MKVYIAGPMTGLPDYNYPAFFRAAEVIRALGDEPLNPAEGMIDLHQPWAWCMRRALRLLLDADAVAMLPGWQSSRGARLEYVIAQQLGMPVIELDE